jgi:hypothetical protein
MFTQKAKLIWIIGDPGNQCLDRWSFVMYVLVTFPDNVRMYILMGSTSTAIIQRRKVLGDLS